MTTEPLSRVLDDVAAHVATLPTARRAAPLALYMLVSDAACAQQSVLGRCSDADLPVPRLKRGESVIEFFHSSSFSSRAAAPLNSAVALAAVLFSTVVASTTESLPAKYSITVLMPEASA